LSGITLMNMEVLAGETTVSYSCNQVVKMGQQDPMNGTKCLDSDRYSELNITCDSYSCTSSTAKQSCKTGSIKSGNDCNTEFDKSGSLSEVCN